MWNFHADIFFHSSGVKFTHFDLRHQFIGILKKLPDQDTYRLKQRIIVILAEWDQLLLDDFSRYRWARTSELCDFSLVYVSKSKFHGECYVSAHLEVLIPHSLIHTDLRMSPDAGLSIVYGLKLFFETSLWLNRYHYHGSPSWI
jgi:hypothetical protein